MSTTKAQRHCPECGTLLKAIYQAGGRLRFRCDHCHKTMRLRVTIGPDQPSAWVREHFPERWGSSPAPMDQAPPPPAPTLILPTKERW